jgi:hypothetical protein
MTTDAMQCNVPVTNADYKNIPIRSSNRQNAQQAKHTRVAGSFRKSELKPAFACMEVSVAFISYGKSRAVPL